MASCDSTIEVKHSGNWPFELLLLFMLMLSMTGIWAAYSELRQIRQSIDAIKGEVPMSVLGN